MDKIEVELYLKKQKSFFPADKLAILKEKLLSLNVSQFNAIKLKKLKSPSFFTAISFLFGFIGVDRFMLGDIAMGILKWFTCGGAFLWYIYDLIKISSKVREVNFKEITSMI